MASTPPIHASRPSDQTSERDASITAEQSAAAHKARFRASLAWAIDEYARTLEKLSK